MSTKRSRILKTFFAASLIGCDATSQSATDAEKVESSLEETQDRIKSGLESLQETEEVLDNIILHIKEEEGRYDTAS